MVFKYLLENLSGDVYFPINFFVTPRTRSTAKERRGRNAAIAVFAEFYYGNDKSAQKVKIKPLPGLPVCRRTCSDFSRKIGRRPNVPC